jgi:hypothetical protein
LNTKGAGIEGPAIQWTTQWKHEGQDQKQLTFK